MKVKTIELNDILKYDQPTKFIVSSDNYDDSFTTPVLTAGKTFILGYTDEKEGVFNNLPAIIFDDFTTSFHYVDFPFKVKSSAMKILTPRSSDVSIKYIYYIMQCLKVDTELHKRYWISKFSKLKIQLPPLKTQEHIASILDDAAALRDKTAQLLEEYDLLAQSIFLEMFGDPVSNPKGWEKEKLVKLAPIERITIRPEDIKDGTKYIGLSSIEKDTGEILEVTAVTENELKSNKFAFNENHILYGRLRPYLNKVANPTCSGICSTDIITLLPDLEKSNKPFITHYLKGKWHVEWANNNTSGANLPRLVMKNFSKLKIINPPISLQNEFAEKIALIERQKELARQELKESEDLFNCLLQKAFKGELVHEPQEV